MEGVYTKDIVGHGILYVNSFGAFKLRFTDGENHYACKAYSLNAKNEIMFNVVKLSEPDNDLKEGLNKTIEEIKKTKPFVFKLKGNKYVGEKNGVIYYAIKIFNNIVVMEKDKYFNVLDISLNHKIKKISNLLNRVRMKLRKI
jgi:hypothetical protein